jgi:CheY-like chemotaxis protein
MATRDTPACVLVVDDDPFVRDLISLVLEDEGYTVVSAADHAAALHMALTHRPAVILTDLSIPGLQGGELLASYRQIPNIEAAIVVISGQSNLERFATQADADAFIAKPFDLTMLINTVEQVVSASMHQPIQAVTLPDCAQYQN